MFMIAGDEHNRNIGKLRRRSQMFYDMPCTMVVARDDEAVGLRMRQAIHEITCINFVVQVGEIMNLYHFKLPASDPGGILCIAL